MNFDGTILGGSATNVVAGGGVYIVEFGNSDLTTCSAVASAEGGSRWANVFPGFPNTNGVGVVWTAADFNLGTVTNPQAAHFHLIVACD